MFFLFYIASLIDSMYVLIVCLVVSETDCIVKCNFFKMYCVSKFYTCIKTIIQSENPFEYQF